MVPSGNGIVPARYAFIATSLPKTAPKLLSLPASWADETHFQSRYPAGFSFTHGAPSSAIPDVGAIEAATQNIAATETSRSAVLFIVVPFEWDFYTSYVVRDRNAYPCAEPAALANADPSPLKGIRDDSGIFFG